MSANLDWDHFIDVYGDSFKRSKNVESDTRQGIKFRGHSNVSNHPEILLDILDHNGKNLEPTKYLDDYTELYHFLLKRGFINKGYNQFYIKHKLILKVISKDESFHHYSMLGSSSGEQNTQVVELPKPVNYKPENLKKIQQK